MGRMTKILHVACSPRGQARPGRVPAVDRMVQDGIEADQRIVNLLILSPSSSNVTVPPPLVTGSCSAACLGTGDITPIVSNSATAVGNNLNIKVGTPDI